MLIKHLTINIYRNTYIHVPIFFNAL